MNRATVNCARLIHFDDESCGAVLHQVDRVLEHPEYVSFYHSFIKNPQNNKFSQIISEFTRINRIKQKIFNVCQID